MRKKLWAFLITAAVISNVCGCEMTRRGTDDGDAVQSSAVGAVETDNTEEGAAEGSSQQQTIPFVTKNCIYKLNHFGDRLIQTDLHGKKLNKFDLDADWSCDYLRVSDHYICYADVKEDNTTLCVAPIRQTDNGEEIIWEEKEEIVKERDADGWSIDYVSLVEPYLVYTTDTVYRYDLNTKETLPLGTPEQFGNVSFHYNWWLLPTVYDGKMYMDSYADDGSTTVYQVDLETWEAQELFSYTDDTMHTDDAMLELMEVKGPLLCMDTMQGFDDKDFRLICFDTENDTKTTVTREDISAVLKRENLWEADSKKHLWRINDSFSYDDRIYMQVSMSWIKKDPIKMMGEKGPVSVERTLLLSCPWDNIRDISYEKEISEWWYDRAERATDWGEDDYFEEFSRGGIMTLYDDELYMDYSDQNGYHMVAYHMATKKYREVDKHEVSYQLMDYNAY